MIRQRLHDLKNHPGVRKYTANISWMLFARVFTLGVSFLTTLYIARQLGPTNFGELDYALAVIGILAPLASFGIGTVLQRELIKHPEEHNELNGTAFVLNFFFSLLATLLAVLFAILWQLDFISKILIVVLSLTYTIGTFQILQQEFYARADSKIPSLITMGVWLAISTSKVAVLMLGKGIIWLAVISVLEQLLYAAGLIIAYRFYARGSLLAWRFSLRHAPVMLKTGGAVALAGFFTLIYARIDQVFIRHLMGAHAVGLYSAGVRLVDLWNTIPALLITGLYPALVNAKTTSEDLYRSRMRRVLFTLAFLGFMLAFITSMTAPILMKYIFGPDFVAGAASLRIYAWSIVGTFLGIYVMNTLFTDDHKKVLVVTSVFPAIINVLLNFWFIPIFGIIGAAYATVISYSITPLIPFIFSTTRKRFVQLFW